MVFVAFAVSTALAAKEISIKNLSDGYGYGYVTIDQAKESLGKNKSTPVMKTPVKQKSVIKTAEFKKPPAVKKATAPEVKKPVRQKASATAVIKTAKAKKVKEKSFVKKRLRRHKRPVAVKLPQNTTQYKVVRGDSLWRIAKATGTSVPVLAKLNGIRNPARIDAGWVIKIPQVSREQKLATLKKELASLNAKVKKVQEQIAKVESTPASAVPTTPSASVTGPAPDTVSAPAVPTVQPQVIFL